MNKYHIRQLEYEVKKYTRIAQSNSSVDLASSFVLRGGAGSVEIHAHPTPTLSQQAITRPQLAIAALEISRFSTARC